MKPAKIYDLEYINDGLFTKFMPVTKAGEEAWREMAKEDGVAAVYVCQANSVLAQLRTAGYSVRKAKVCKKSINKIMAELDVL